MNPNMPKDFSFLTELILHIIKSKNIIAGHKHFIILKHIDILQSEFFTFRILLERFTNNACFLCTTHKISKIETPIKSRFYCIRLPLFEHEHIVSIFDKYLKMEINKYLLEKKSRDFIKAIFFAQVQINEPHLLTEDFCNYNFPLIKSFIDNFSKKTSNLEDIRQFSYKCCQYNVSIQDLTIDLLKIIPTNKNNKLNTNKKIDIIKKAQEIDHNLSLTNKGREPLYIESLLCQILLE
jgi:hypothetical protein